MRQTGEVIRKAGSRAWVKVCGPGAACESCSGCVKLSDTSSKIDQVFEVEDSLGVSVGDQVILESSNQILLRAVAILYGVPLAGLILGYLVSFFFTKNDGLSGIWSLGGLLAGAAAARMLVRRLGTTVVPRLVSHSLNRSEGG